MTSLHRSILSTLALHAAESRPYLTLPELHGYLHKDWADKDARAPTLREVARGASELAETGRVRTENGLHALAGTQPLGKENVTARKKLREARFALLFLKTVPFVRAIAVTGSVSFDSAKETSDLDLFILAEKGRVWTVRLVALALLELLGKRRDRTARNGKICLNYFMAESAQPPVQNIASATLFKRAIPVFGTRFFFDYLSRNTWMKSFLYRPEHDKKEGVNRLQATSYKLQAGFKSIGELFLIGAAGVLFERWARSWQTKRLRHKNGGRDDASHFTLTDDIIMLHHPTPKNKIVMERYHRIMADMNL